MPIEELEEMPARVAETANRLRLIQVDTQELAPDVRRQYLADELNQALNAINPAERSAFLTELGAWFPTWDGNVAVDTAPVAARSALDEQDLTDSSFLVARLVEQAPTLPDDTRRIITENLRSAGLTRGDGQWSSETAAAVSAKLQLAATDRMNADPTLDLLGILLDFALPLDKLVWTTWKQLAPQSPVRRPNPLQKTLARYCAGDPAVPRERVIQEVEELRKWTVAMLSAIGQAGKRFAQKQATLLQPDEIEKSVKAESGSMFKGLPARCWEKYVQLAGTLDANSIQKEITSDFAELAKRLATGL